MLIFTGLVRQATLNEFSWFFEHSKAPRLRLFSEFVAQEIVLPDGPFEGRKFRWERQPFTRLYASLVDSGFWTRYAVTGCTQSGKSLISFASPILYHLFEIGETVVVGLPDMDMAQDKWSESILPVIERTRYRDLMPLRGSGSRGGKVDTIRFRNGATLKFMSGGGGDKARAGFTARVAVITEVDGMDKVGAGSREADKITQIEGRLRSFGNRKRIYMECTASITAGRIWQEYQSGTTSRILLRCPHCGKRVSPEREHLAGWQDAQSIVEARQLAYFFCPSCQAAWSEEDRRAANLAAVVIHRGQELTPEGQIVGQPVATDTLGFRWSAVNNFFLTAGDVGADEWKASRSIDEENAEKEMRQFVWTLPHDPPTWEATPLDPVGLAARMVKTPKGLVPEWADHLTMGVDCGKYLLHWIVIAWRADGTGHIVDYGRVEVPSQQMVVERAMMTAFAELRDQIEKGWASSEGEWIPEQVWIDAGWKNKAVYPFCREAGQRYLPYIGRGVGQQYEEQYNRPKKTGALVVYIGQDYHIVRVPDQGSYLVEIDADAWKGEVHDRLATSMDQAGAMTLYHALPREHMSLAKHLTAEKAVEEFIQGRGMVRRWERIRRNNHWFDAAYAATCAAHFCGVRLIAVPKAPPPAPAAESSSLTTPDGRPFLITDR
jgi:phage terminase large subunit GpA-like protein